MLISYKLIKYAKIIDYGLQKILTRAKYRLIPAGFSSDLLKLSINHYSQAHFSVILGPHLEISGFDFSVIL